ncbi:MAG: C25 family cysteine peptidase [Bacteroidota bacterium]|nr:C25 family cysteine peptidase [Bacteroidota bacterium]
MKKFLLPLLLLTGLLAQSQAYNNEWINYSRTYYKFKVGATGLYRISQSTLTSIGIGSTAAEQFQLWRNGRQVPLFTSVQTGPLGGADYIEFWGEMNDGKPDSVLYKNPDHQLSNKWSLETDTAAFFLTVNPSGGNARLVPTANTLPTAIPVEPFFIHTEGAYYRDKINAGYAAVVGEYVHSSAYDQGEGWTSVDMQPANPATGFAGTLLRFDRSGLNAYTGAGAPSPILKINATGNALNPRRLDVKANGNQVSDQTMDYFDYIKLQVPLALSVIASGSVTVDIKNICTTTVNDRMVVAQTELVYPRLFNFGGASKFEFILPANATGNYLEISGFNHNSVSPVLYDLTNGQRYVCDISNPALVKVVLQPSATQRKLLLVSQHSSVSVAVTTFQQRNFVNYSLASNQGNYLIISHPALMAGAGGSNPVDDYKNYRSSAVGGSHNAKVYQIDELVDQFSFGIKKNPLSVRNFVRWARNTYTTVPIKNVLLIGKGLTYTQYRTFESSPEVERLGLVPTFGWPASDNLLTVEPGLNETPKVPIGRISAITPAEVTIYLNKVKQYEQAQALPSPLIRDKAWLKNVAHVIGASDGSLGTILTNSMARFTQIISDTLYGGNVSTFSKLSAAPVEQASSARLQNLFEEGIGLMTYFGHSSASSLEFNLDNPDQYNNAGKYPVTIVMGCNAGNFYNYNTLRFTTKETLSEKFVLADQRGSIAFIASTHFGIVHYLDIFNTRTYNALSVSHYGKTLGELLIESIAQMYNLTTQNDYYARFHCEQTTIHGDPALKLNGSTPKPDYVIEDQLAKVTPSFVSVAESAFKIDSKFMNIGKAENKKIVVEVKRTYPNLSTVVIRRDTIPGIRYIDSLSYSFDILPSRDKGLNKISICIDADNAVDELYESNNCIVKDVFVYEDEARPVYPYTYAIVKRQDQKLIASTANPFMSARQFTMEMDTTEFFNSPSKIVRTINSSGGIIEFTPGVTLVDSMVYYWRVAPVPANGQPVWNKSSFVYLSPTGPNSSDLGFNQSHFFQQTKSTYDRVKLDSASRLLKFANVSNNLFIRQGTWITSGARNEAELSVAINGIPAIRLCCWYSSLVINVFDPISFKPWRNQTLIPSSGSGVSSYPGVGLYESTANTCRDDEERYFTFEYRYTDTASRRKIMKFLNETIPNGHYIVVRNFSLNSIYGFPEAFVNTWKADTALYGSGISLYHTLKNNGFPEIDSFYRTRPFAFVYKKNDASFAPKSVVGAGMFDNPTLSVDCNTIDTIGYVTSPSFGPARQWKQLKWRGIGDPTGDVATVDVIGVRADGSEAALFRDITTAQQTFDVSSINAATYPYMKLRMRTADSIHYTPYQLRYWRLTFTPVPEGGVNPDISFQFRDSVDVGEPASFKVAFKNISEVNFDSLRVKMVLIDGNNFSHTLINEKRKPLMVGDTVQVFHRLETANYPGVNQVYFEFNPNNDQPEQYHFNNYAFRSLRVRGDTLNPLLDVTFDGVHILNTDIVSAKPDIIIKLKDEARWMILDDTSLLTLKVRYPNGSLRRFYFSNDSVRFTPAGQAPNADNTASINFKPYFTEDGEYEMIVTGKDKNSNVSGSANDIQYRVVFNVINKPMISNMLNYPNPFTTSTAFVFTITGTEVPQNIKIEIMTVTGKIVREITKNELGPLQIGRNITDFKWDGTDQFGQKLANGIYLYRVVTNLNGKSLDKYNGTSSRLDVDGRPVVVTPGVNNTDKYFNKGYGKMYLMR